MLTLRLKTDYVWLPKNGSTTLSRWFGYDYHLIDGCVDIKPEDLNDPWTVSRDPVERFKSAYQQFFKFQSIDMVIDYLPELIKTTTIKANHVRPQLDRVEGMLPSDFSRVFTMSEMDKVKLYCEELVGHTLEDIVENQTETLVLTGDQEAKLKDFYQKDYEAGWC
jgi:hypothetical protein